MRKKLSAFILLYAFWLLLTVNVEHGKLLFDPGFVIVGALLTLLVVFLTAGKYPRREWLLNPVRWLWLFIYVPYFLYLCVKANLDVAYRVIHPDLPIRPGIVKVTTSLKTNLAKTFLANSITLTPGTLVVDIVGSDLYVHWINVTTDDPEQQRQAIVQPFEPLLKRIFE
jgi:multicomponent Na+:H+ antiporter subunit E